MRSGNPPARIACEKEKRKGQTGGRKCFLYQTTYMQMTDLKVGKVGTYVQTERKKPANETRLTD